MRKIISLCLIAAIVLFNMGLVSVPKVGAVEPYPALNPIEDAYVQGGSNAGKVMSPTTNAVHVQAKNSQNNTDTSRRGYMKFDLNGVSSVDSAKLRVLIANVDGLNTLQIYGVENDNWSESSITWNNAPVKPQNPITTINVPITASAGEWYEIDITSFIKQQHAGDKVASLLFMVTTNNFLTIKATGDSSAANWPKLVVTPEDDIIAPPTPTAINVNSENVTLDVGGTSQVTANVRDQYNTIMSDLTVNWSSMNPNVATVVNGLITAVHPGTTVVKAVYQNLSSNNINVTVNQITQVAVPIEDAYVQGGSNAGKVMSPTTNAVHVQAKNSLNNTDTSRKGYMKFDLNGFSTVDSAKLRVLIANVEGANTLQIYGVENDNWSESSITWNNAPVKPQNPITTINVPITTSAGGWYEIDITSFIKQQHAGDKVASLLFMVTTNNFLTIKATGDSSAANWPKLVVTPEDEMLVFGVNQAQNAEQMKAELEKAELGLLLTGYNTLSQEGQNLVIQAMLTNRPTNGYSNKDAVQEALYSTVEVEGIKVLNAAVTVPEMMTALSSPALRLNVAEYAALLISKKEIVAQEVITSRPSGGYASKTDIIEAINQSIASLSILKLGTPNPLPELSEEELTVPVPPAADTTVELTLGTQEEFVNAINNAQGAGHVTKIIMKSNTAVPITTTMNAFDMSNGKIVIVEFNGGSLDFDPGKGLGFYANHGTPVNAASLGKVSNDTTVTLAVTVPADLHVGDYIKVVSDDRLPSGRTNSRKLGEAMKIKAINGQILTLDGELFDQELYLTNVRISKYLGASEALWLLNLKTEGDRNVPVTQLSLKSLVKPRIISPYQEYNIGNFIMVNDCVDATITDPYLAYGLNGVFPNTTYGIYSASSKGTLTYRTPGSEVSPNMTGIRHSIDSGANSPTSQADIANYGADLYMKAYGLQGWDTLDTNFANHQDSRNMLFDSLSIKDEAAGINGFGIGLTLRGNGHTVRNVDISYNKYGIQIYNERNLFATTGPVEVGGDNIVIDGGNISVSENVFVSSSNLSTTNPELGYVPLGRIYTMNSPHWESFTTGGMFLLDFQIQLSMSGDVIKPTGSAKNVFELRGSSYLKANNVTVDLTEFKGNSITLFDVAAGSKVDYKSMNIVNPNHKTVIISSGAGTINLEEEPPVSTTSYNLTGPSSVISEESFQLTYGLVNVTNSVYAKSLTVSYDPTVLEYVEANSLLSGFNVVGSTATPGNIKIIEASTGSSSPVIGNVDLLSLSFRALTPTVNTNVYMSGIVLGDQFGNELTLSSGSGHSLSVVAPIVVNKSELATVIGEATMAVANVKVLNPDAPRFGYYAQSDINAMNAAIVAANIVFDQSNATQLQVDEAKNALLQALTVFLASVSQFASVGDLAIIAANYQANSSAANWQSLRMYDLNDDGMLDLYDLVSMASRILN